MTTPACLIAALLRRNRGNSAYGLTATAVNNTALTTYTFNNVNLGPGDDPNRWIFVVSTNQATNDNSSGATWTLNIGGVAATEILRRANGSQVEYIHALKVPAGDTASIQAVMSTAGRCCAIAVYVVYGDVNITPVDIKHLISTTPSSTITTTVGGFVLVCASTNTGTIGIFNGVTTDLSQVVGTQNQVVAFGSLFNVAGTSVTYGYSPAGSSANMVGASFKWN